MDGPKCKDASCRCNPCKCSPDTICCSTAQGKVTDACACSKPCKCNPCNCK